MNWCILVEFARDEDWQQINSPERFTSKVENNIVTLLKESVDCRLCTDNLQWRFGTWLGVFCL